MKITKEIENRIIEEVKKYPNNLKAAFTIVANKHKVKVSTVRACYYTKLRDTVPMVIMITDVGMTINQKNAHVVKQLKTKAKLKYPLIDTKVLTNSQKIAFFDVIMKM